MGGSGTESFAASGRCPRASTAVLTSARLGKMLWRFLSEEAVVSRSSVFQIRSTQVLACHCHRHNGDLKRAGTHAQTDLIAELKRLGVSQGHVVLSCSRSNVRFNLD